MLDVNTIQNQRYNLKTVKKEKLDINKLINRKEFKKQRADREYQKIINICIKKIKLANQYHKTDLIYKIPPHIFRCPEYDLNECMNKLIPKYKNHDPNDKLLSEIIKSDILTIYHSKYNPNGVSK